MLDLKKIFDQLDQWAHLAEQKGFPFDAKLFQKQFEKRRTLIQKIEKLKSEKKNFSRQFLKEDPAQRDLLSQKSQKWDQILKKEEQSLKKVEEWLFDQQLRIPNEFAPHIPLGEDESDNQLIRKGGPTPPSGPERDHVLLGEKQDLFSIPQGVKISGSRSYVLKNKGADLEMALHQFAADFLRKAGFQRWRVPTLVKRDALQWTGYWPLGQEEAYQMEEGRFWLSGTSEVGLVGAYAQEKIELKDLPLKHYALTTCFRKEAGSYGKDTRGLYRVHEFLKTEQVIFCKPDREEQKHYLNLLVKQVTDLLELLELPFRVVQSCSKELGLGQYEKIDIETWMPSRGTYSETHSCSSFLDYQTRRLKCKLKDSKDFPYSLNGTAIATPRLLIPFLENHVRKNEEIYLPKALRSYLENKSFL